MAGKRSHDRKTYQKIDEFDIFNIVKKKKCDYGRSYYLTAIQLTKDLSRGWMVVHAKFQKISRNIFLAALIRNFWVGRLVRVVGQSEIS